MACCLTAPNHDLNQCWLILKGVLWHSPQSNFTRSDDEINCQAWYSPSPKIQSYVHLIIIIISIPANIVYILKQGPCFIPYTRPVQLSWDFNLMANGTLSSPWMDPGVIKPTHNSIPNNTIQWTELYNWRCTTTTPSQTIPYSGLSFTIGPVQL